MAGQAGSNDMRVSRAGRDSVVTREDSRLEGGDGVYCTVINISIALKV